MAIARGAAVLVTRAGSQRPGTVVREVEPHVTESLNPSENETTRRYEVSMPEHGPLPAHSGVCFEHELTVVLHDARAPRQD